MVVQFVQSVSVELTVLERVDGAVWWVVKLKPRFASFADPLCNELGVEPCNMGAK